MEGKILTFWIVDTLSGILLTEVAGWGRPQN
jgi:hypothetical protein